MLQLIVVCFVLQESEGGLYVCMNTFLGFGREHVERHYRKTGQSVYMHLKRHVKEVSFLVPLNYYRKLCRFNVTVGLETCQVSATNIRADLKV